MERTELREQFFAEVKRDPYSHMVARMMAHAWAEGYEQALRDAETMLEGWPSNDSSAAKAVEHMRRSKCFSDRCDDAIEFLTDASKKAEAQAIIAMAQIGSLLGGPKPPA